LRQRIIPIRAIISAPSRSARSVGYLEQSGSAATAPAFRLMTQTIGSKAAMTTTSSRS
jgi:hypothetical protein